MVYLVFDERKKGLHWCISYLNYRFSLTEIESFSSVQNIHTYMKILIFTRQNKKKTYVILKRIWKIYQDYKDAVTPVFLYSQKMKHNEW